MIDTSAPLGLLGGTFDPVHFGHLRLAEECAEALRLSQVHLVPAARPWQRSGLITPAAHRVAMVRLAVEGNPRLAVDEREVGREGPSYSIETLTSLREEIGPRRALVMIVGSDQFLNLPTWHRWEDLFGQAHIAVARRANEPFDLKLLPGRLAEAVEPRLTVDVAALGEPAGRVFNIEMTPLSISSSQIRMLTRSGASARYLLPEAVREYARAHGLYA